MAGTCSTGLPNLIIAGVHKSGTTSLYSYLGRHPEICASYKKEIRFFSGVVNSGSEPDLDEYARHFAHCHSERYRLEASPNYLYYDSVPELIGRTLPDAKILVVLREPVDRLLSLFERARPELPGLTFAEFVDASLAWQPGDGGHYVFTRGLRDGFYVKYLRKWRHVFGENLKVLFFDDLKADSLKVTANVCAWLGLDTDCLRDQCFEVENRTLQYRHAVLQKHMSRLYMRTEPFWRRHYRLKGVFKATYDILNGGKVEPRRAKAETLAKLNAVYAPYNAELRDFLGPEGLPAWLQATSPRVPKSSSHVGPNGLSLP